MTGRVVAIWIKRAHRGPMDPVAQATLVARRGIADNADIGGRRQITLLSQQAWADHTRALGQIDPVVRRANVLIDAIDFDGRRGATLRVGAAFLRINGETRPCRSLDFAVPGLETALKPAWAAGAYAEVIDGGIIAPGDEVAWVDRTPDLDRL